MLSSEMPTQRATLKERQEILPNLTAVRIFAAGYVLLYHCFGNPPLEPQPHWYQAWINAGYLGVTLFFVLSGFILAYTAPVHTDVRKFYVRRFARIYPLYFAALLWGVPHFLRHAAYPPGHVIAADMLLIQSWFIPSFSAALNPPSWSLSTEAFFYLSFPLLLPLVRRFIGHWKLLLAAAAGFALLPQVSAHLWLWSHGVAESYNLYWFLSIPLFRLGEFMVGIVLGTHYSRTRARISGRKTFCAAVLSIAMLGLQGHIPFDVVCRGLLALPFGFLIFCLAGWRSRVLSSAPMQLLGEISYGVYLLQSPLDSTINFIVLGLHLGSGLHVAALTNTLLLLTILPVAYCFYITVERRGRNLILRLFDVPSHPKPIETVARSLP